MIDLGFIEATFEAASKQCRNRCEAIEGLLQAVWITVMKTK